jgi:hypothetical protein
LRSLKNLNSSDGALGQSQKLKAASEEQITAKNEAQRIAASHTGLNTEHSTLNFRLLTYGEETLRPGGRFAHLLRRATHQTKVPVARNCFANEGLIARKPVSGSARHRWARENSKHRRTATRQRGFCSSSLEQHPLDLIKPGMPPENGPLEIVRKAASLRTPA